jgi:hypothetical protein
MDDDGIVRTRSYLMELMEHQKEAIAQLGNGKILYGGVGSGKSATAIGYYVARESPRDIVVITTAKKRDSLDWEGTAAKFGISTRSDLSIHGSITIDSWNNISAYVGDQFVGKLFIFDEQRLVGNGAWVKAFLKIAKNNRWIMLSATPGDTWIDYAPVFIANGWYKNITEFKMEHVVYAPYVKFPKIVRYVGTDKLERLRNQILVEMPYDKHTKRIMNYLQVGYNKELWDKAVKDRWHVFEDRPIKDVGELFRVMRKIVNTDPTRLDTIRDLMKVHPRLIVFYNFNYELEILRTLYGEVEVGEWNGHKKTPVPTTDRWVYLVQFVAGSEAWECTSTDAMVLYSLTYSYKNFMQAQGRIDRLDTKFTDLYYYILASWAPIDNYIRRALRDKKNFNESELAKSLENW